MKRGDVVYIRIDDAVGSEVRKNRPGVVVSIDVFNKNRSTVVVVPVSTEKTDRKAHPHETALAAGEGGLDKPGFTLTDQVRTIDKGRIVEVCGTLAPPRMVDITSKLMVVLGYTPLP